MVSQQHHSDSVWTRLFGKVFWFTSSTCNKWNVTREVHWSYLNHFYNNLKAVDIFTGNEPLIIQCVIDDCLQMMTILLMVTGNHLLMSLMCDHDLEQWISDDQSKSSSAVQCPGVPGSVSPVELCSCCITCSFLTHPPPATIARRLSTQHSLLRTRELFSWHWDTCPDTGDKERSQCVTAEEMIHSLMIGKNAGEWWWRVLARLVVVWTSWFWSTSAAQCSVRVRQWSSEDVTTGALNLGLTD